MKNLLSPLGDIYFQPVADGLHEIIESLHPSSVIIIADDNTQKFCVPLVISHVNTTHTIIIPHGETHKDLDSCRHIWSELLKLGADRKALVLNVGGGVITDIGGFAAACYLRGIRFANIPTTLLGMTDAAFGGKVGINFEGAKNYLGAVAFPQFVWMDKEFIQTLPGVEIISGLAETVKHAIIGSHELWEYLGGLPSRDQIEWEAILSLSIPVKLAITESDVYEEGERKKLNFGHTIGHAIESFFLKTNQPLSHGQSVTLGMLAESRMAYQVGLLNNTDFNAIVMRIDHLLEPERISLPTFDDLISWLQKDKKTTLGVVGYSLPDGIGSCRWDVKTDEQEVRKGLGWLSNHLEAQ